MLKCFRVSSLTIALGAALLALTAVPSLRADGFNNWRTIVTFSGPVDIGGTALSAGTYVFRTLGDYRNLVEIMNNDETHLIALVPAVSAQAAEPSGHTRIELKESPSGSPERVHEWFYPGETIGWEFLAPAHNTVRPSD
jgi:hypothetical protein